MKIVVIGGTGLIGSKLVAKLDEHEHQAVPASPNTGVNTLTGEGLSEVLDGAHVVVDVSNSPDWNDDAVMHFFQTSSRNLLAAEAAAGVGHHVALSVVGTDRLLESGYFRAKMAQEKLIEQSSIPYSIVHATQFFEFINGIADQATDGNAVTLPPALIQPMAADDVASALARVAVGPPLNGIVEIAGPGRVPPRRAHPRRPAGAQRSSRGDHRPARALLRHRGERAHPPPRRWREHRRDPFRRLADERHGPGSAPRPPSSEGRQPCMRST